MKHKFKDYLTIYFSSGWLFLIPYLFLYITTWYFEINKDILLDKYYCLHMFHLIGYGYLFYNRFTNIKFDQLIFWIAIGSLFLIPGAYLEYPSDALEHIRRIFQWEHLHKINDGIAHYKFSYFWTYSLINFVEPANYQNVLDIYYVFIGLILAYQFYELGIKLMNSLFWAKVSLVILIITYGNSSFSFFRYYALSSTMVCLLGFLVFLNALISYNSGYNKKNILFMFLGIILAVFNHPQAILFIISALVSFYCYTILLKKGNVLGSVFLLKIGIFIYFLFFIFYNTFAQSEFKQIIENIHKTNNWLYPWGGFKIISTNLDYTGPKRFLQIIGLLGVLNLFSAILLLRKNEIIAWISITPILLLLYPPFSIPLAYILEKWNTIIVYHRILLVIPSGFCIVLTLKKISEFKKIKENLSSRNVANIVLLLVLLFSIVPHPLNYGRVINLIDTSFDRYKISELQKTANILKLKLKLDSDSIILSDSTSQFYLSACLGLKVAGQRKGWLKAENINQRIKKIGGIKSILHDKRISAILCVNRDLDLMHHSSMLGSASGHWRENFINESLAYNSSSIEKLDELLEYGWHKSKLNPWYDLYTPRNTEND